MIDKDGGNRHYSLTVYYDVFSNSGCTCSWPEDLDPSSALIVRYKGAKEISVANTSHWGIIQVKRSVAADPFAILRDKIGMAADG